MKESLTKSLIQVKKKQGRLYLKDPMGSTSNLLRTNRRFEILPKVSMIELEQLYKTRQHFVCSVKTDTTTPGKLGRAVGFSTRGHRASRAGVGF